MNKSRKLFLVFIIFLVVASCYKFLFLGLFPIPGDLLVAEYTPWRKYSFLGYNPGSYPTKVQYFDTLRQLYPWKVFSIESIKQGIFPFWNPHNFSGHPLFANSQSAVLYPFNLLYFIFNFPIAWSLLTLMQPILAFIFTYAYGRRIGLSRMASILSGISYGFCLYMSVFLEYNSMGHVILWLPFILYCIEDTIRKRPFAYIGISFGIAFCALAGHIQLFGFILLFLFIYIYLRFVFVKANDRNELVKGVVFICIGVGISCIQLIPTFELILHAARSNHEYTFFIQTLLLQLHQFVHIFSPDFFGNPATRNYLLNDTYVGNAIYIGLLPLFFCLYSWTHGIRGLNKIFFILSFLILLYMVRTPITELLYRFQIPIFSNSSPTNAAFLLSFSLSIAAGYGFDTWRESKTHKEYRWLVFGLAIFIGYSLVVRFIHPISTKNILYTVLVWGIASMLWYSIDLKGKKIRRIVLGSCLLLTLVDLLYFYYKFNPFVPSRLVYPKTEVIQIIKDKQQYDRSWGYKYAAIDANFATLLGIYSPDGYDPLYPRIYGSFIQLTQGKGIDSKFTSSTRSDAVIPRDEGLSTDNNRNKILNLLGVRYVIDRAENGSTEIDYPASRYAQIYSQDGWTIFQNNDAAPRVFLTNKYVLYHNDEEFGTLFYQSGFNPAETILIPTDAISLEKLHTLVYDPDASAKIQQYSANAVIISTSSTVPQLLFLSDTYYPGWLAKVDGVETHIIRSHYAFRSIYIPEGKHTVEFQYVSYSFLFGIVLSIGSVIVLMGAILFVFRSRHQTHT